MIDACIGSTHWEACDTCKKTGDDGCEEEDEITLSLYYVINTNGRKSNMHIEYYPDEWKTVSTHHVCDYHKLDPNRSHPGCTCHSTHSNVRITHCGLMRTISNSIHNGEENNEWN